MSEGVSMFDEIVAIANRGVVTADDFEQFIGKTNWLAFEISEPLGEHAGGDPFVSGVIYAFRLVGTYDTVEEADRTGYGVKPGQVLIAVEMTRHTERWMAMDADELAIRMDES